MKLHPPAVSRHGPHDDDAPPTPSATIQHSGTSFHAGSSFRVVIKPQPTLAERLTSAYPAFVHGIEQWFESPEKELRSAAEIDREQFGACAPGDLTQRSRVRTQLGRVRCTVAQWLTNGFHHAVAVIAVFWRPWTGRFQRWMLPIPSLAIQLCLGSLYSMSIFNQPMDAVWGKVGANAYAFTIAIGEWSSLTYRAAASRAPVTTALPAAHCSRRRARRAAAGQLHRAPRALQVLRLRRHAVPCFVGLRVPRGLHEADRDHVRALRHPTRSRRSVRLCRRRRKYVPVVRRLQTPCRRHDR